MYYLYKRSIECVKCVTTTLSVEGLHDMLHMRPTLKNHDIFLCASSKNRKLKLKTMLLNIQR